MSEQVDFYTKNELDKLGNALIFLADHIPNLTKTKALKLIYLLQEFSIKKYGIPFFNLRFDVWKLGPVSRDLFIELSSKPTLLKGFIGKRFVDGKDFILSKNQFSDDEFNDLEIDLLEFTVEKFKNSSAKELVEITHRKHSLWYQTAKKEGLLDSFESGTRNSSNTALDFSKLLFDKPHLKSFYKNHQAFLQQVHSLKS